MGELYNLGVRIGELSYRIENLERIAASHNSFIENHENAIQAINDSIGSLGRIIDNTEEISKLGAEKLVDELKETVDENQELADKNVKAVNVWVERVKELKKEVSQLSEELCLLKSRIEVLEAK